MHARVGAAKGTHPALDRPHEHKRRTPLPAPRVSIRPALAGEADLLTDMAVRAKGHWGYATADLLRWLPELERAALAAQAEVSGLAFRREAQALVLELAAPPPAPSRSRRGRGR